MSFFKVGHHLSGVQRQKPLLGRQQGDALHHTAKGRWRWAPLRFQLIPGQIPEIKLGTIEKNFNYSKKINSC
jgi:hypothetical protein